jgi:hypothetical protein
MSQEPLFLPRRLAIELLAQAQKSPDAPVRGVIVARNGELVGVRPDGGALGEGEAVWAEYRPAADRSEPAAERQLLISLDTKGVLQLRCREIVRGEIKERELKIR